MAPETRDTIPRLHHLAAHLRGQLAGVKGTDTTFEQARVRYSQTVDRLVTAGLGRRTASRVGDAEAYWAPTQEVLEEAMRLGLVVRDSLPSARRYLDAHRDKRYRLTPSGDELATLAEQDLSAFYDHLTHAVIEGHPYFKALLLELQVAPLVCPEVTEGEVEEARQKDQGTDFWAEWVSARIEIQGGEVDSAMIKSELVAAVRRRFGIKPSDKPPSKAVAEVFNDAISGLVLKGRGLPLGAIDLKVLRAWGSQLRLLDQSRYVPEFSGASVVWLAADLSEADGRIDIRRRGLAEHGSRLAKALVAAYREQARLATSSLAAPYVPIYRIRAQAAYECGVTRALADVVLEQLAAGGYGELQAQVLLHLGRGDRPPASEPIYHRGGSRRYEVTMVFRR